MNGAVNLVEATHPADKARWAASLARDPDALGAFYICVATTGIYCLPTCAARPLRKNVSFAPTRLAAERAGFRPCKRCRPERFVAGSISSRLSDIDWTRLEADLNNMGWARLGALLSPEDCAGLIDAYDDDDKYRATIAMARHSFGAGEYRYFNDASPAPVGALRAGLYERLAPIARAWSAQLGEARDYPLGHAVYRRLCATKGQTRPTPLILKYGPGDHNCLHQDLYGEEVFPLQVAILLSEPGKDFEGGEFVLTEQRPRRQSRAHVVQPLRGEAVAFAVNDRPVAGAKGFYRAKMRHGVSTIQTGGRYSLGIIFHDAK